MFGKKEIEQLKTENEQLKLAYEEVKKSYGLSKSKELKEEKMKNKQIIIDYEEYKELEGKIKELENFNKELKECFTINAEFTYYAPGLNNSVKTLVVDSNKLNKIFETHKVELKK